MKLFTSNKPLAGGETPQTPLGFVVAGLTQHQQHNPGSTFASKAVSRAVISLEGRDAATQQELTTCVSGLTTALESIFQEHGLGKMYTTSQRNAAVAAGIITGDIQATLSAPTTHQGTSLENATVIDNMGSDVVGKRVALEAYDEKENKSSVMYTIAYNMQAARQDEFGEAFFPTCVVSPDQAGMTITIRLVQVFDEVRKGITGAANDFNKRNIIRALIDPSILRNDQTNLVPVFRDESKAKFVDENLLAPRDVEVAGETVTTSALLMGAKLDLTGISTIDSLLETGVMDSTDSIDTDIRLASIYLKVVDGNVSEVIKFNTGRLPNSQFQYAPQGNYRQMNLAFSTVSLKVDDTVVQADSSTSALLADIVSGHYAVRLAVDVSGGVNCETGVTSLFANTMTVVSVTGTDGVQLSLASGNGKAIADLFIGASFVGYDLAARRTNMNRRQRGQLLDTTFQHQIYNVPLLSPITVPRPLTVGDANDSSDLAALVTATHIRTSNTAVEELLRARDTLAEIVSANDKTDMGPETLGMARYLVKPFFEEFALDVVTVTDSIKSHERAADIQAALVNKLRDMAFRMYRDSGYKAAADALAGGQAKAPTVIIGTDPVLARYLLVTGDLRMLSNDFNVKVVSTLNQNMTGRIIMSFGDFDTAEQGIPNPLHFGLMAWKPEIVLTLPIHRNGANSKELTVQPAFRHIVNLPILASLTVTGIEDVVSAKVPVYMHTV